MASGISRVSPAAKSVMNVRHKKCRTLKIQYSVQSADRSWPRQKLSIHKILENNSSELQYWPKWDEKTAPSIVVYLAVFLDVY